MLRRKEKSVSKLDYISFQASKSKDSALAQHKTELNHPEEKDGELTQTARLD